MKAKNFLIWVLFFSGTSFFSCDEQTEFANQQVTAEQTGREFIGYLDGATVVIDDRETFVTNWQERMREAGVEAKLVDFKVEKIESMPYYQLVGISDDRTVKASILVEKVENKIYTLSPDHLQARRASFGPTSCICNGCTQGCSPFRRPNGKCLCSPCETQGDCSKTEILE